MSETKSKKLAPKMFGGASSAWRKARGLKLALIAGLPIVVVLFCVGDASGARPSPPHGGLSSWRKPDKNVKDIVDKIKDDFEDRSEFTLVRVIKYRTQIVTGTMYHVLIKARDKHTDEEHRVTLRILEQPWKDVLRLQDFKVEKGEVAGSSKGKDKKPRPKPGGLGEVKQPDRFIRGIVNKIKGDFKKRSKLTLVEILSYRTQMVAGTMYSVMVTARTDDGDIKNVILRIWEKPWEKFLKLDEFKIVESTEWPDYDN